MTAFLQVDLSYLNLRSRRLPCSPSPTRPPDLSDRSTGVERCLHRLLLVQMRRCFQSMLILEDRMIRVCSRSLGDNCGLA